MRKFSAAAGLKWEITQISCDGRNRFWNLPHEQQFSHPPNVNIRRLIDNTFFSCHVYVLQSLNINI